MQQEQSNHGTETKDGLRAKVAQLLGPVYPGPGFGPPQLKGTADYHGWCLDDLIFTNADGEKIPAYFLHPPDKHAPVPALIYAHAHGNAYAMGRAEVIEGRRSLQGPYGVDLVRLGIAALCIDMPCFGARQHPPESARAKAHLWQGNTLFGQMLAEQRAGIDFLANYAAVDAQRIGAVGFSMGSTIAWWLAALDPRMRATAALCSFADLGRLVQTPAHDGHGIYMTVPGLLEVARSGQIAGLAAPRALQICVGLEDWSTPEGALNRGLDDLRASYDAAGASERLSIHVAPDAGHEETATMRAAVLEFLRRELCR